MEGCDWERIGEIIGGIVWYGFCVPSAVITIVVAIFGN